MDATFDNSTNASTDRLIGTRSVCSLVEVSDRQLRRLVSIGTFPKPDMKLGKSLRWKLSTITKFIEGQWVA